MKLIATMMLALFAGVASAQWLDVNNSLEDSLHLPVCTSTGEQRNPIVLTSYPDGGYIVIWEDGRNSATGGVDIYAQKFNSQGVRIWATNGVPVANGRYSEHYTFSSNSDYRNRSFACTDSAGGFYITFVDDSISNYTWQRLYVQHVLSNGTRSLGAGGKIMEISTVPNLVMAPQLIADGYKGFFLVWFSVPYYHAVNAYCYRDINGTLRLYGGGRLNENKIQTSSIGACGIQTSVSTISANVTDYFVWSDGQGGCNVLMDLNGNGAQGKMLAFNRLWRAKRDAVSTTYFRNSSGTACKRINTYAKGEVYPLYQTKTDFQTVACGGGSGPAYVYTNYRLLSNGFLVLDDSGVDYTGIKGATVLTNGNIAVDLIAVSTRRRVNNVTSNFYCQGYAFRTDIYDSIPYQHASYNNPDFGYNAVAPANLNNLNIFRDTLLGTSTSYPDLTIAAGGKHFYVAGMVGASPRQVRLQHLEVNRINTDSFAIQYKTNAAGTPEKQGVALGGELSTGFTGTSITYDIPLITVSKTGQAFFWIKDGYRTTRISPINIGGASLTWGAMGRLNSTGVYNNGGYANDQPVACFNPTGDKVFMAWRDGRSIPGNTDYNIFGTQYININTAGYTPPVRSIKPLFYFSTDGYTTPAVMYGTNLTYSPFELYNTYQQIGMSTVLSILDNVYLGGVYLRVFQHINSPIRRYNGDAYLNRNYTLQFDSFRTNSVANVRLYFSTAEYNAFKRADPTITSPDKLAVVWQPSTATTAPGAYIPITGEKFISPVAWDSVAGGYYIEVQIPGRGHLFIRKEATNTLCQGASTSFTSNLAGATYRWQVDTGSGFVNISNNANYNGATSNTLQITNADNRFNNYRYRCVVDNTKYSNTYSLMIANVWTGAVNNQWETAGNWSCNQVPDANTNVLIKVGTVTVNTSTAICRTLTVYTGSNVNVTPTSKLTVVQ